MAEKAKKTVAGKEVRTTEDLVKRGDRGKILVIARGAVGLAKGKPTGKGTDKYFEGKGSQNGYLHGLGKEVDKKGRKGKVWSASDETITELAKLAKAANKDVNEGNFTGSVKAFIDGLRSKLGGGRVGAKKVTPILTW